MVSRRDGTRLWLQRREKSRAPAVRHGFEGAAETPAVTVWRARRKHQHYVAIEVANGDYIQGPYGRLTVPNRNACRQRAIAICDLNCGPFPCTSGPESGTNFGARFRHQNRTAAAQVKRTEIARMCRRGLEKSPFQAALGPDSGTKTGARFWHQKRCRFWSQLARFLARTAPRFRVPIASFPDVV